MFGNDIFVIYYCTFHSFNNKKKYSMKILSSNYQIIFEYVSILDYILNIDIFTQNILFIYFLIQ